MNRFIILFLFSLGILSTCVFAVEVIPLNEGWNFHRGFQAPASEIVKVTLPHTWNAGDGMFGNADYYRGLCNYSRKLSVPAHYRGKRFFLKVMAAQTVADIFIDHYFVMQHKGGYTAFVAELTDFLVPGKESVLEIRVSNAQTMDIAPICGDFNMFGGLYRGVELLVTEDVCIEPAYYASSGVFFTQSDVSEKKAHLKIEALLSARETTVTGCEVEFRLYDKEKLLCRVASAEVGEDKKVMMDIVLERPHLWDGVKNPYLYKGVVILRKDGRYHAFPDNASLPGHIHRTAFRRSGRQRRQPQTAVGFAAQSRFRCVDRAFRVPPFGNWWMGWRFTTSFGAEKKQETFSDFLLGGAAGGRLVFSFESSGQGGPMMK